MNGSALLSVIPHEVCSIIASLAPVASLLPLRNCGVISEEDLQVNITEIYQHPRRKETIKLPPAIKQVDCYLLYALSAHRSFPSPGNLSALAERFTYLHKTSQERLERTLDAIYIMHTTHPSHIHPRLTPTVGLLLNLLVCSLIQLLPNLAPKVTIAIIPLVKRIVASPFTNVHEDGKLFELIFLIFALCPEDTSLIDDHLPQIFTVMMPAAITARNVNTVKALVFEYTKDGKLIPFNSVQRMACTIGTNTDPTTHAVFLEATHLMLERASFTDMNIASMSTFVERTSHSFLLALAFPYAIRQDKALGVQILLYCTLPYFAGLVEEIDPTELQWYARKMLEMLDESSRAAVDEIPKIQLLEKILLAR